MFLAKCPTYAPKAQPHARVYRYMQHTATPNVHTIHGIVADNT